MADDTRHKPRDSLSGFDRKRLRQQLRERMGVTPNSAMFESRGQSWHTTQSEERQEHQRRQLLEHHLREAKPNEHRFIQHLRERLADAGRLAPVKVDKQALATQTKPRPPARTKPSDGKYVALSQRVTRLANLQRELERDDRVAAKTSDKFKQRGHFVQVFEPFKEGEREEILLQGQTAAIRNLTYVFLNMMERN